MWFLKGYSRERIILSRIFKIFKIFRVQLPEMQLPEMQLLEMQLLEMYEQFK